MKTIFTKLFLASALSFVVLSFAQYNSNDDYYGNNNYGNNNGYEYYYDDYNYPDEYYYDYPSDYYTNDFYSSYYNDYRNAIISINWNRLFVEFRLSPWQIREIRMLNDRFRDYDYWYSYYRYNPDRWYYDRFIALERILGPRIYVTFYGRYYHNYNPIVYYQNYRVKHYRHTVYVTPRYRNVDVRTFRNNGFRDGGFRNNNSPRNNNHAESPRGNGGFRDISPRNQGGNSSDVTPRNNGGFRSDAPKNLGGNNNPKNFGNQNNTPRNDGGFRSEPKKDQPRNMGNNEVRNNTGFRGSNDKSSGNSGNRGNSGGRNGGFR